MNQCAWASQLMLSVTLLAATASGEDAFLAQWQEVRNRQPVGVSLALSTPKSTFFLGETIPIEFAFTATERETFLVWAPWMDETFVVDLKASIDDLRRPRRGGFAYSGPGPSFLTDKPSVAKMDLNELVRFRQPGTYRVYVLSHRVRELTERERAQVHLHVYGGGAPLELVSNILTLEILPAPEAWVKERIATAIAFLDGSESTNLTRADARRVLLFLNTREAAVDLAKRLGDDPIDLVIFSSPFIKEMSAVVEQRLIAPDQPVTSGYLDALAAMAVPEKPGDDMKRLIESREQKRNEYATKLFATVMLKDWTARVVSMYTLLDTGTRSGRPEPWLLGIVAWTIANFQSFQPNMLYGLLSGRMWEALKGPRMILVLRALSSNSSDLSITDLALRDLYEISPDEARAVMVSALSKPKGSFQSYSLSRLPFDTLPVADEPLLARMESGEYVDPLIARFATGAIVQRVEEAYLRRDERPRNCITPLLFYFFRYDPTFGERELRRIFSTQSTYPACWNASWPTHELGKYAMSPALERVAIEYLASGIVVIKNGFAELLGRYGSAAAEQPLWDTMVYFRSWWKGREDELQQPINREGRQFESTLRIALTQSTAWSLTKEDLERLLTLCSSEECRSDVTGRLRSWRPRSG